MQTTSKKLRLALMSVFRLSIALCCFIFVCTSAQAQNWQNHATSDNTSVVKRHETGSVVSGNKLYVLGGRGNRPNQVFDSVQNKWSTLAPMPMELHHFQPVVLNGYIYVIGAFTCCFPTEPSISDIYRLNLSTNVWETHGTIPADRLRGSAGAVAHNNKIYLIGGNTNGHSGGAVAWFDEYNPANGQWTTLPDAPERRDHFSAAVVGNKMVAAAGRTTSIGFGGMVAKTDTYNFSTNSWTSSASIPTPRAGSMIGVAAGNLIVMGGETNTQIPAHSEVEAFDVASNRWRSLPDLILGRHGGAGGVINNILHAITGNSVRGGGREVTDHETLTLNDTDNDGLFDFEDATNNQITNNQSQDSDNDGLDDAEEQTLGTNPNSADSDNDGLQDASEVNQYQTDPAKADSDNDGLNDGEEINQHQTDPLQADSDNDGLQDGAEVNQHQTNPLQADSDNDGLKDNEEINQHQSNPLLDDTDSDGLVDGDEIGFGTNPTEADSDFDTLSDIDEIQTYNTSPTNSDSDGDSLLDQDELLLYFTDPLLKDSDQDGLDDDAEILIHQSNPNAYDSDGDGVSDATEVAQGSSASNTDQDGDGILNLIDGLDDPDADGIASYLDLDSDNDSIPDLVENGGTDTNNNGMLDGTDNAVNSTEFSNTLVDSDLDGIPNIFDLDSDQDGISDFIESGQQGTNTAGRFSLSDFTDIDQNGWHDSIEVLQDTDNDAIPDYLDLDSDDNGIADVIEVGQTDNDGDGKLDSFIDENLDGFDDSLATLALTINTEDTNEPPTTESTDGDRPIAVGADNSDQSGNAGGGCTVGSSKVDPTLPLTVIALSMLLFSRRRKLVAARSQKTS